MRPRQHADLADDRPDLLGVAAVDALAFQDQVADDALFQGVERGRHLLRRVLRLLVLRQVLGDDALASARRWRRRGRPCRRSACARGTRRRTCLRNSSISGLTAAAGGQRLRRRGPAFCAVPRSGRRSRRCACGRRGWPASIWSSGISRAKPSIMVMALRVPATIRSRSLSSSCECVGISDQFAADPADADGAGRLQERDLRQVQGGAGADHAEDVGIVLPVGRQGAGHDLDFVEVAGREERADGPVDQAGGEDFLGGGPAFALDEAAGELAGGVGLFAVIDGEGEEISPRIGRRPRRRRRASRCRRRVTTTAPWACLASLPVSRMRVWEPKGRSTRTTARIDPPVAGAWRVPQAGDRVPCGERPAASRRKSPKRA